MTKSGRVLSGKPVVFPIPIDFCIEFWNSGCVAVSVQKLFKFFSGQLNLEIL